MRTLILLLIVVGSCFNRTVHAGVGSTVVRDGVEYIYQTLGRTAARDAAETVAKKAAQEGAETVLRKAGAKALEESAEQVTRRAGVIATRASRKAGEAIVHYGESASGIINHFGDDAAEALVKVSSRNGRRLVMLEQELAQSGQAEPLLKLVSQRGDAAVEWLWANKGAVAAGVGATVLLTNPDAVLSAGANLATAAVETAGTSVVQPVVEGVMLTLSRLVLLVGLVGAATYAVWLKAPLLREPISSLVKNGIMQIRTLRK